MGKELQIFSVVVSVWNGVGQGRSSAESWNQHIQQPGSFHIFQAGKEKVLGMAILEEVKEGLS